MNPNLMGGILAVATLVSAGSAVGMNQVIASQIAPESLVEASEEGPSAPEAATPPRVARRGAARRSRVPSAEEYLDGIMRRNLFDVSVIATWNPSPDEPGGGVEQTPLKVRLLGTVVASPAEFSSCLILNEDHPYAMGYSIGDKLADREIVAIEERRIQLKRSDGQIEFLSIDDQEGTDVKPRAAPKTAGDDDDSGIQQTGDNKFSVSRDLFDKYINDMESITKLGRALLHRGPDGSFDGYRLAAIRRNTLADQLGIKNGDIIHSVNGEPLTSLQAAMNAYNTMQTESNFCFEITRRRKPVELCYDVR